RHPGETAVLSQQSDRFLAAASLARYAPNFFVGVPGSDSRLHHGYFYMPYAYLADSNLADDLWAITIVET
ncbi:MAG: hypothetical protein WC100_19580, partial [Sterolibacterium sp.]